MFVLDGMRCIVSVAQVGQMAKGEVPAGRLSTGFCFKRGWSQEFVDSLHVNSDSRNWKALWVG